MTASEGQAEGRGTAATLAAARGRQVCMGGIFVCVRLCQVGRNQSLSGVCCGAWRNTRGSVLVKQRPMHPQPSAIFSGPPSLHPRASQRTPPPTTQAFRLDDHARRSVRQKRPDMAAV